MLDLWHSVMADNGSYFLSAYAVVFGALLGYAWWLRSRLAGLSRQSEAHRRRLP